LGAGRDAPVGAAAAAATASTATTANAQRHPNGIATAGSARPASTAPTGAPACWAPNATPWRATSTSRRSIALTAGLAIAFPTAATTSRTVSASVEAASAAIARQETAVVATHTRMPDTAPIRSTSRPSRVDNSMLTT
jgi:hypothetical protein